LGWSVIDNPKYLKIRAMWRYFKVLQEFKNAGLWSTCLQKGKGAFNVEH
jgi:hypothetical protein